MDVWVFSQCWIKMGRDATMLARRMMGRPLAKDGRHVTFFVGYPRFHLALLINQVPVRNFRFIDQMRSNLSRFGNASATLVVYYAEARLAFPIWFWYST